MVSNPFYLATLYGTLPGENQPTNLDWKSTTYKRKATISTMQYQPLPLPILKPSSTHTHTIYYH